ncbi:hypothetical protein [Flavisolibacter nicotianae]|uniref:hypothetical protein n=1 Tax=Flavisolibacter nicotianae TaxID=2364882 RepID=UPI0013C445C4|nr:hypothetical protein [Flavisolibacter nicotianae]
MQLVMYLGNDFIASVGVNVHQISQPGYMGKLKRRLMAENSQYLQNTTAEPEFLVVDLNAQNLAVQAQPID